MERRIKVPQCLDLAMLRDEFGHQAIDFYLDRIKQRESEGRTYYNPLKTIYLWATADRATNQGYYTSYRGYWRGTKTQELRRIVMAMTDNELLKALDRIRVETRSLVCLGCGHEHGCSVHGCAVLRAVRERLRKIVDKED